MNKLDIFYTVKEIFFDCEMQSTYIARHTAYGQENEAGVFQKIALTGDEYDFFYHALNEAINEVMQNLIKYTTPNRFMCNFEPHHITNYHGEQNEDGQESHFEIITDTYQESTDRRVIRSDWDLQSTRENGLHFTFYLPDTWLKNTAPILVKTLKEAIVQYILYKWFAIALPDRVQSTLAVYSDNMQKVFDMLNFRQKNIIDRTPYIY